MCGSDRAFPLLAALGALAASCTEVVTVPDPPDMTALVSVYGEPTGRLDAAKPEPVLAQASSQLVVLGSGEFGDLLSTIARSIAQRLEATGLGAGGDRLPTSVDAVVSVELPCPGEHGSAGKLEVTTVVKRSELSRVMWGTARGCAVSMPLAGIPVLALDGSIQVYRYSAIEAAGSDATFLVSVEATLADEKRHRRTDFRVRGRAIETRVSTVGGDLIVARRGLDVADVHAANGTFRCSLARRVCAPAK